MPALRCSAAATSLRWPDLFCFAQRAQRRRTGFAMSTTPRSHGMRGWSSRASSRPPQKLILVASLPDPDSRMGGGLIRSSAPLVFRPDPSAADCLIQAVSCPLAATGSLFTEFVEVEASRHNMDVRHRERSADRRRGIASAHAPFGGRSTSRSAARHRPIFAAQGRACPRLPRRLGRALCC